MKRFAPAAWAALGGGVVASGLYFTGMLLPAQQPAETVAAPTQPRELALTPGQQELTGIKVAPIESMTVETERKGFARAIDASALAAIDADRIAAMAALRASQSEARRLQALYEADQSASLRALEAARAIAAADSAKLALAERRAGLELGAGLARFSAGELSNLVREIASGRATLIRIDMPGVPMAAGQSVMIGAESESNTVRIIGAAAQGDSKLQTPGALAIVRGSAARALPIGRIVPASVAGGPAKSGLFVPSSAIVRWQGSRWVFRQTGKAFERIELAGGEAVPGGWLVSEDFSAGDRIAVEGAGSLLAAELGGGVKEE